MENNEQKDFINVPAYIEDLIKKLYKLKQKQNEILIIVKDYMEYHNIPKETPLSLLKNFAEDDVDPNQMKLDI